MRGSCQEGVAKIVEVGKPDQIQILAGEPFDLGDIRPRGEFLQELGEFGLQQNTVAAGVFGQNPDLARGGIDETLRDCDPGAVGIAEEPLFGGVGRKSRIKCIKVCEAKSNSNLCSKLV